MRSPDAIAFRSRAPDRGRRSRLAIEIGIALAVKFLLLYAIWNASFSDPVSKTMTGQRIGSDLFGPVSGQATSREARDDPRP